LHLSPRFASVRRTPLSRYRHNGGADQGRSSGSKVRLTPSQWVHVLHTCRALFEVREMTSFFRNHQFKVVLAFERAR